MTQDDRRQAVREAVMSAVRCIEENEGRAGAYVAEAVMGIDRRCWYDWKSGRYEPLLETTLALLTSAKRKISLDIAMDKLPNAQELRRRIRYHLIGLPKKGVELTSSDYRTVRYIIRTPRYEKKGSLPKLSTLMRIAKAFGVRWTVFIEPIRV